MKKSVLMLFTAWLLSLAVSCDPEKLQPTIPEEPQVTTETITASMATSGTKTAISDSDGSFSWSGDDAIAVHTSEGHYVISTGTTVRGSNNEFADFTVSYSGTRDFFAVYPATAARENGSTLRLWLPQTYDISTSSNHRYDRTIEKNYSPLPMIAANNASGGLSFKQVCGLLRITVNNVPKTAQKLSVQFFSSSDEPTSRLRVNGDFDISGTPVPGTSTIALEATSDYEESTITFVIGTGSTWRDNVVLNVPVPEGYVHRIRVRALNAAGNMIIDIPRTIEWNCQRNLVSGRMGGKKVTVALPVFEVQAGASPVRVKVTRANLRYNSSDAGNGHFGFSIPEAPYMMVEGNGIQPVHYNNGATTSSLFGWGTSKFLSFDARFWNEPYYTGWLEGSYYGPLVSLNTVGYEYTDWGYSYAGAVANKYRTPTKDEFEKLFTHGCNSVGLGCINDGRNYVYGCIILPHGCEWDSHSNAIIPYHETGSDYTEYHYRLGHGFVTFSANVFTKEQWSIMEEEYGAVFFPCAGYRHFESETFTPAAGIIYDSIRYVTRATKGNASLNDSDGGEGFYWTATMNQPNDAYFVWFGKNRFEIGHSNTYKGCSVRLIQDIN